MESIELDIAFRIRALQLFHRVMHLWRHQQSIVIPSAEHKPDGVDVGISSFLSSLRVRFRSFETGEINIKITLPLAHIKFVTLVYMLFYIKWFWMNSVDWDIIEINVTTAKIMKNMDGNYIR